MMLQSMAGTVDSVGEVVAHIGEGEGIALGEHAGRGECTERSRNRAVSSADGFR